MPSEASLLASLELVRSALATTTACALGRTAPPESSESSTTAPKVPLPKSGSRSPSKQKLRIPLGLSNCVIEEDNEFPPSNIRVRLAITENTVCYGRKFLRYKSSKPLDTLHIKVPSVLPEVRKQCIYLLLCSPLLGAWQLAGSFWGATERENAEMAPLFLLPVSCWFTQTV